MAEPQPGAPAGSTGGTRSATAATFQVNDASLRGLRTTFQGLSKDVSDLNKAILDLDRTGGASLDRLRQRLGGVALGGGTGAAGRPTIGGSSTFSGGSSAARIAGSRIAGQGPAQPGGALGGGSGAGGGSGGGGGGGGGRDDGMSWRTKAVAGTLAVAGAAATYVNRRSGDIGSLDQVFTQGAISAGRGMNGEAYTDARRFLTGSGNASDGIGGYQSASDLATGVGTLTTALGGGVSNARTRGALTSAGAMAALRPDAGLTGSTSAAANLYDASTQNRLRAIGVGTQGRTNGQLQTPAQTYQQIVQRVYRGQKPTVQMIQEGMQPGAPLYRTLAAAGLGADAMEEFSRYATAQATLGGSASRVDAALKAVQQGRQTTDSKLAGLQSIRASQNAVGGAGARATGETTADTRGGIVSSNSGLGGLQDRTTGFFGGLNSRLGGVPGGLLGINSVFGGAQVQSAAGALGGIGGALFAGQSLSSLRGGRGGSGGSGGTGAGGGGGVDPGGDTTRVFVTNWPGGGVGGGSGGTGGGGGGALGGILGKLGPGAIGIPGLGAISRLASISRTGMGGLEALGGGSVLGGAAVAGGAYAGASSLIAGLRGGAQNTLNEGMKARGSKQAGNGGRGYDTWKELTAHQTFGWIPGIGGKIDQGTGYKYDKLAADHIAGKHPSAFRDCPLCEKGVPNGQKGTATAASSTPAAPPVTFNSLNDSTRPQMSVGGVVPGNHDRDTVGIKATPGELVVPKSVAARFGGAQTLMSMLGFRGMGGAGGHYASGGEVWGNPNDPNFRSANIVDVPGIAGGVNKRDVSKFQQFLSALNARGYHPQSVGGYNNRNIAGTSTKSNHAYGAAIDVDPGRNPRYGSGAGGPFALPKDVGTLAAQFGLNWGGNYKSSKDYMHFEDSSAPASSGSSSGSGVPSTITAAGVNSTPPGASLASVGNSLGGDEHSLLAGILGNNYASVGSAGGGSGAQAAGTSGSGTSASGPAVGGNVQTWIKSALGILNLDFTKYGSAIATIIQHESGGNPKAQNNTDSNAKAGHPSKGIMQMIDSTFQRWELPGHGDIWNPVDNIAAATRYAIGRYGSMDNVPGIKSLNSGGPYKGYRTGTWQTDNEIAELHAGEMVIPERTASKVRDMIRAQGQAVQIPAQRSVGGSAVSSGSITIQVSAPITLVGKATQQQAEDFVGMVDTAWRRRATMEKVGKG